MRGATVKVIYVCLISYYRRGPVGCKDYVLEFIMEVIHNCKQNFLESHNPEFLKFLFKFPVT